METVSAENKKTIWKSVANVRDSVENFCNKELFPFIVVAIAFLFHVFALDLVGIITFALFATITILCFKDCRAGLVAICSVVFTVSIKNGPGYTTGADYYGQKMRRRQKKYREISLEYNLFSIKANVWIQVAVTVVQYAVCGYGLYRLWTGDITYGTMILLLQQGSGLSNSFNQLVAVVPSFLNSSICANRIRELVELPREVRIPESTKLNEYIKDGFKIRMKGVSFAYKQGKQLRQVTSQRTPQG